MLVHDETFNLLKHRAVGGVVVVAIHFSGYDDAYRRLLRSHCARLHGTCVRAEKKIVCYVQRILHVARGVVLRNVEQLKVIIVAFDFGAFLDFKAEADKRVENFVFDESKRMQRAELFFAR